MTKEEMLRGHTAPYQFYIVEDGISVENEGIIDEYNNFKGEMNMTNETEIKPRVLAEGEMLTSVPVTELDTNIISEKSIAYEEVSTNMLNVLDKGLEEAKERFTPMVEAAIKEGVLPMNIFERQALLDKEKDDIDNKPPNDKLADEIADMSDEELRAAIASEATDIQEGEGTVLAPEGFDPKNDANVINSMMLREMSDEEAMEIYNIAVRAKADPSFNVAAALPKRIYDNIAVNCKVMNVRSAKAINNYSRMLVGALLDEMSLDKECKAFQDDLEKAIAFPEIVDMYAEHTRKQMEEDLIAKAELITDDPVLKAELLAVSKAYTDAYTFSRQLELLKDDLFIKRIEKKVRRYERCCSDYDFIMSRSVLRISPIKCLFTELPNVLKVNENQIKAYIVMLMEVSKNINANDKPGTWFLYNSVRNIITLARTGNKKTDFSNEAIQNLKNLFNELEKRHTTLHSV